MPKVDKKNKKDNEEKAFAHAVISWYPGHIAKARKKIIEDLKLIDIVVEVLDARVPKSSKNNDFEEYIKNKKRIIALNKTDLADDNITKKWIAFYNNKGFKCVEINANVGKGIDTLVETIKKEYKEDKDKYEQKGRVGRHCRVMIMGIPNVGKSTLINKIANKNIANVSNRPGVTKQNQWIRLNDEIDLLDTPGLLWPKLGDDNVGMNLAFINSIGENAYDSEEVAYYLLEFLLNNYKEKIEERYGISIDNNDKFDVLQIRDEIAQKRGCILSGGRINEVKISELLLNEFQSGKIGKISIDKI